MGTLGYKQFTERHRPHIQPPGANFFVTYRLAGSIPKPIVRQYKAKKDWLTNEVSRVRRITLASDSPEMIAWLERVEAFNREWFVKFEDILHKAETGPMWMENQKVATAVAESLISGDGKDYRLDTFSVMSNHVHAILQPYLSEENLFEYFDAEGNLLFESEYPSLSRIMQRIKGSSARECNLLLSRRGQFWEHESFDHFIRAGKLMRSVRYVLNNPVKARLVKDWRDWRWNYCRKELIERL